jgi:hypothetical protein
MQSMKSAVGLVICGVIFSSSAFASQFMTLQEKADAIQQVRNEANAANDLNTILIDKYNNHRQDITSNDYAAMAHASNILRTAGKQIADIQAIPAAPVAIPSKLIAPPKMMNVPNQTTVLTPVRQPQPIAQLTPPTPVHQSTPALQLTPASIAQKVPTPDYTQVIKTVEAKPSILSTGINSTAQTITPTTSITVAKPVNHISIVNGVDGKKGVNGKDDVNSKDGKNRANGVTITITKKEVDKTTIAKVDSTINKVNINTQTVKTLSTQTSAQAQDLNAAKQFFAQQQASTKNNFTSLKNEVEDNMKQANAGISGAMAMAGLPQVQTNQRVMFSAGGATYNGESALAVGASVNFTDHVVGKASFSDDTANNMGASVGVGIGF